VRETGGMNLLSVVFMACIGVNWRRRSSKHLVPFLATSSTSSALRSWYAPHSRALPGRDRGHLILACQLSAAMTAGHTVQYDLMVETGRETRQVVCARTLLLVCLLMHTFAVLVAVAADGA
jgi:hypothetical protein